MTHKLPAFSEAQAAKIFFAATQRSLRFTGTSTYLNAARMVLLMYRANKRKESPNSPLVEEWDKIILRRVSPVDPNEKANKNALHELIMEPNPKGIINNMLSQLNEQLAAAPPEEQAFAENEPAIPEELLSEATNPEIGDFSDVFAALEKEESEPKAR